ncbi:hypothetical protein BD410DRAFT_843077 [Rickenella mellea]|uniref:Uncharacterized protein n=1 Tax=Rickenella mellea TaxID=50990 RepID=A0A4Y7PTA0_9AGAM|nr:hypothetical protein BD410DRAFT_843077 [Rickenella mellea]
MNLKFAVQLASVVLTLFLDIVVFTLTFAKTIHQAIEMRKLGLGNGLGYFILRDGTMYFLAKLVFGVVATTIFFVPASGAIGNWVGIIIHMSDVLTIILINRLVLNLRRVSHIQEGNVPTLGPIGTIQEPAFATYSILGNLGAPLRMGEEDKHDDDVTEEVNIDDGAEVVEEREIGNHTEIIEEPRFPSEV